MSSELFDLLVGIPNYSISGIAIALVVVLLSQSCKLRGIPTVGSNGWLGSWWAGLRYSTNALDVIQEGYEKHKSAPFKAAELYRWVVVISSREHIDELWKAPESTLSIAEALNDRIYVEYTLGHEVHHNPYHVSIVRSQLTRSLGGLYPAIRDEIIMAFDDVLSVSGNEWGSVSVLSSVQRVVCRATNRVFVGLPLCRNPDWIDLNIQYTIDVVKGRAVIELFPNFLKPIAARYFTNVDQGKQRGMELLRPTIEGRQKYLNERANDWVERPNDFLEWLMEEAEGPELTVKLLTNRILSINVAAIHTTSISFTHALFYLAANPEYIQPLREEVESIVEEEGWSKGALDKMRKVDSFLKECQRVEGNSGVSLSRKAMKDFTFSDGTLVPKGTLVVTAMQSIHHDEAFYEDAHRFRPFRFADLCQEDDGGVRYLFASTTPEYLPFGHGRRACPGRFLAAIELKTMLAHVVVTYDVKLEGDASRPRSLRFATAILPDPQAKVMLRRRVD